MNTFKMPSFFGISGVLFLIFMVFTSSLASEPEAIEYRLMTVGNTSFEGTMSLARFSVSANGDESKLSEIQVLIHPDNILMGSSDGNVIDLVGNMKAERVLIRQRRDDLVFFTTDFKAVTMNRQELQQMINMLENMRGPGNTDQLDSNNVAIIETGERQTIQGYTALKWTAKKADTNSEWHVWVTEDINVPWGMLSQKWLLRHTILGDLPAEEWLNDGKFPVKAEHYHGGQLSEVIRFENITHERHSRSRFQIPEQYQQITFQQMLFDRMRNR